MLTRILCPLSTRKKQAIIHTRILYMYLNVSATSKSLHIMFYLSMKYIVILLQRKLTIANFRLLIGDKNIDKTLDCNSFLLFLYVLFDSMFYVHGKQLM